MRGKAQDDNLVMELVESTLTQPTGQREQYLRHACKDDPELFEEVWNYVQIEQRMSSFLLEPVCQLFAIERPFQPGQILDGRFHIVREVAEGGMGVVYEALDEKLQRRIAIKCAKAGFRKQLPPEARNATEISHPNVCKIFEIHTVSTPKGDIDFLTMEFLDGETLAERLRRGSLPENERRTLALQLCAGLAEAHRKGVIHGDLKTGNVILTQAVGGSTRAVITDFGLAQQPEGTDGIARPGVRGGTPDYMAPELLRGEQASVATDVYALGVILHELACGRRPARTGEPPQARLDPKAMPSAKWNAIVSRCLQVDPARRFQNAEEVARAFAPNRVVRWATAAAAVVLVAATSVWTTYYKVAPPKETVQLAMSPLPSPLENLSRDTWNRLDRLSGGSHIKFTVLPLRRASEAGVDSQPEAQAALGATHVLNVEARQEGDAVTLRVSLTDTRSGGEHEWQPVYAATELRYVPLALAGFVMDKLLLPPPQPEPSVKPTARKDYFLGVKLSKRAATAIDAITALERAVVADPDSPLIYAALAEAQWIKYEQTQDRSWLEKAKSSAAKAAIRFPDAAQLHRIRGALESTEGRYGVAIRELLRATELNPRDSESFRRLGRAYEQNDQFPEALDALDNGIKAEPGNPGTYLTLATFYYNRGQFDKAIETYKDLVARHGDLAASHYALGNAYNQIGKFPDAEGELRKAIELGESSDLWHSLGNSLMHQGRDSESINAYEKARELGGDTPLLLINLGVAYARAGEKQKARQTFEKGFTLAGEIVEQKPKLGLAHAEYGYLAARLNHAKIALHEATQALRLPPDNQNTRWMVAVTYEALSERQLTLNLLKDTPQKMLPGLLGKLERYPEMERLKNNPDFQTMMQLNPE